MQLRGHRLSVFARECARLPYERHFLEGGNLARTHNGRGGKSGKFKVAHQNVPIDFGMLGTRNHGQEIFSRFSTQGIG